MRIAIFTVLWVGLLLSAGPSQAQQPTAADSAARPPAAIGEATGSPTDIIIRTNGDELPGRVLSIRPDNIRYLAASPDLGRTTDTLQLATADVFMIRYANGTKEVMRPAAPADPASVLSGLNAAQRYDRGRQDSRKYYQPAKGVFWGTYGATLAGYVYGGVITGGVIGLTPPRRQNLRAPEPALLNDPSYYEGYRRQAQNRKLGKAAAGFGVGVATEVALFAVVVAILFSGLH